jgi:hypothetical protein
VIWPWRKPKDEPAPETSAQEAAENLAKVRASPDGVDGPHVPKAGGKR